jgi:hypothetical protein
MKKKIIYFVLIVLGTSLAVQVLMSLPRLWNYAGNPDSWFGFWGNIIGAILGVLGAYYVMNAQLQSDKEAICLKEIKDERPYFFINSLSETEINFEFYNVSNSLLNYTDIRVFYHKGDKEKQYSLGHIKSGTQIVQPLDIGVKPDLIVITAQALLGENILFIDGSREGEGITDTLIYDYQGVIKVYTGPDDYHKFDDVIKNIING